MAENLTCPKCGAPVTDGPNLLCPKCLLALAFADDLKDAAATAVALPVPQPGDRIGRYKLLEKIGEGGCGVVYMAEQHEPVRRRVALKVIKLGMDTREVIGRFEAERQALALMEHPNIATVFDGGTTDTGRPYFVMELVRGTPITDYCDEHKLSTRERLEIFQQVCRAVQHAHQKGIIHRDLKPSNVLVTLNDGVPVPKVIDFGIAKATGQQLTDKTFFTRFRQLIGTPAYMSPEQAQMSSVDIDTRSDIYSLGVLLYELLIGRTPFDSQDLMQAGLEEMLRIIREKEPARPSARLSTLAAEELTTVATRRQTEPPKLLHLLRGDLDWIVMKCLEKDRGRRYETANGLLHDIERHLRTEPIEARPPSVSYRVGRFVQRHRLVVGATSLVIVSLIAAALISVLMARSANRARQSAETQKTSADIARNAEENESYAVRIGLALTRIENGAPEQARPLLDGAVPRLRGWEWHWLKQSLEAFPQSHNDIDGVWFGAFSSDGKYYVLGGQDTAARKGKIVVWNVHQRQSWTITNMSSHNLIAVGFSADSERVFAANSFELSFWNLSTSNCVFGFKPPTEGVFAASITGDRLVTHIPWDDRDEFSFWDTGSGLAPARLLSTIPNRAMPGETKRMTPRVFLSPDFRRMLTGEGRLDTNAALAAITPPSVLRDAMPLRRLIWDTDAGRLFGTWPESRFAIMERPSEGGSAYFSPDGRRVLITWPSYTTRFPGTRVRVYETDSGRQISSWNGGQYSAGLSVGAVAFSAIGDRVAITRSFLDRASNQKTVIEVCDVSTGRLLTAFGTSSVELIAFLPDGIRLVAGDSSGQLNVWDSTTGRALGEMAPKAGYLPTGQPIFSPDGRRMLSRPASNSWKPCLWDLHASEASLTLYPTPEPQIELVPVFSWFSPDGQHVACLYQNSRHSSRGDPLSIIKVYSLTTGREIASIKSTNNITNFHFSSDGGRIVANEHQEISVRAPNYLDADIVVLYEFPTGRELKRLHARGRWTTPDGRRIVGIEGELAFYRSWPLTNSNILRVWDAETGETVAEHDSPTERYAMTGDSRFIVQLKPRHTLLDPVTLNPLIPIPEEIQGAIWFFPKTRRILAGARREQSGTSNARPAMVLYDSESQRPLASWDVATTLRDQPIWDRSEGTSADEQRCVIVTGTASAFVLDTRTGKRLSELIGHGDRIENALIFPDGKRVLTASADGTAKLWDAATGREVLTFPCPSSFRTRTMPRRIALSPDGQRVLTINKTGLTIRSAVPGLGAARLSSLPVKPPLEPDADLYATRYGVEAPRRMQAMGISLRDPRTPPQLLDLSIAYNGSIRTKWSLKDPDDSQQRNYALTSLPRQRQTIGGVDFDARGVILPFNARIAFTRSSLGGGPRDIDVRRYCKRIHFLHATMGKDKEGVHSALYFIHDASGATNTIYITYGEDLRDCMYDDRPLAGSNRSAAVWQGKTEKGETLRLFRTTWDNPQPEVEIESIDFEAGGQAATPFLMAITVDDAEAPAWNTAAEKVSR